MISRCSQMAADEQHRDYWSIVSDLVSLIHRTRGYEWVNDTLAPAEFEREAGGNVVILDDVNPPGIVELSRLEDCNLRLREALHFLLEARARRRSGASAALPQAGGRCNGD